MADWLKEKVIQIVSNVMGLGPDQISEESSPESVEAWDSLKHMKLTLALEEEFNVRFTDETIVGMLSVGLIIEAVSNLRQMSNAFQR